MNNIFRTLRLVPVQIMLLLLTAIPTAQGADAAARPDGTVTQGASAAAVQNTPADTNLISGQTVKTIRSVLSTAPDQTPEATFHFPAPPVAPTLAPVSPVTPRASGQSNAPASGTMGIIPYLTKLTGQTDSAAKPDAANARAGTTPAVRAVPPVHQVAPVQPLAHGRPADTGQSLPPAFTSMVNKILSSTPARTVLAAQAGIRTDGADRNQTVSSGKPVSIVDDTGRTVTLKSPATRIIALYGGFNEILAAMGQEHRLIARTKADTMPPTIEALPSIGTHMQPNPEIITALGPDCILQLGGRKQAAETQQVLEDLGFPVIFFQPSNFSELFSVIRRMGVLTASEEKARLLIGSLQKRLDAVAQAVAKAPSRPTVFFEVRYPNLLGAGGQSIVDDIIRHAGGTNVLPADQKLVRLNEEELIRLNPQVYLMQQGPMNPTPVPLHERPHFATLRAVTDGKVLPVDEQIFSRPGPRAVDAVEELARFLHPQSFADAPQSDTNAAQ